jgi:hypothetical protein
VGGREGREGDKKGKEGREGKKEGNGQKSFIRIKDP